MNEAYCVLGTSPRSAPWIWVSPLGMALSVTWPLTPVPKGEMELKGATTLSLAANATEETRHAARAMDARTRCMMDLLGCRFRCPDSRTVALDERGASQLSVITMSACEGKHVTSQCACIRQTEMDAILHASAEVIA